MSLELRSQVNEGAAVLFCSGRLAEEEASDLRSAVSELLRQHPQLTLDLKDVTYINSVGLSALVGLYSIARTAGGVIKYVNLKVGADFSRATTATAA